MHFLLVMCLTVTLVVNETVHDNRLCVHLVEYSKCDILYYIYLDILYSKLSFVNNIRLHELTMSNTYKTIIKFNQ